MQDQLDNKRAETAAIKNAVDKAKRALEGLGSMEIPSAEPLKTEASQEPLAASLAINGKSGVGGNPPQLERETLGWRLLETSLE